MYTSIELFAGAGGLALGVEKAGFNTIGLIEFDKDAADTLKKNRPNWNVIHDDIANISVLNLEEYFGIKSRELDLLSGGAPCQAFSYAGKRLGLEDARGTLFYHYAVFLEKLQPKMFLFENIYMMQEQQNCSVIELCEYLNSENIKVCIDMCHLYCQAHIYKKNIEEFLERYLNKEKCERQVYQIHFAYTANDDGYIDRTTHAIMHPNVEALSYDKQLLYKYGMKDCNWVTEVSEKDYVSRKDQIEEIKMLEKSE